MAVAREYGWTVTSVWLRSDGSGHTNIWGWSWKDPQQRLVVVYAGVIAAGTASGAEEDYTITATILAHYPAEERDCAEEAARAEAARIVAHRADEIDRNASLLLDNGRL